MGASFPYSPGPSLQQVLLQPSPLLDTLLEACPCPGFPGLLPRPSGSGAPLKYREDPISHPASHTDLPLPTPHPLFLVFPRAGV